MLVSIEGIDGCGKGTQTARIIDRARASGARAATLTFPRYGETHFSESISAYLNGDYGDLQSVPARFAALLYAGDRLESRDELESLIAGHDLVVLDRYVASNLAYQAARVPPDERAALTQWIARVEFDVYHLPKPDLQILLDVPADVARGLVDRKGRRTYTTKKADLHEADVTYLAAVREVYHALARHDEQGAWRTVACTDEEGAMLSVEQITDTIWSIIDAA